MALLVLAQACILESRFRPAYSLSSQARMLFARHSDAEGQAEASAVLSYSASALGRNVEALDAARDGIAFASCDDSPATQAFGLNYSGVASFWARDYATSRAVLETSAWFVTTRSPSKAASFQPLVNLAFCELLRVLEPERKGWSSQDYSALVGALGRVTELQDQGLAGFLNKATADIGFLLVDFARCFLACRLGAHEDADTHYLSCVSRLSRLRRVGWLHSLLWWARLERARARGQTTKALASAQAMRQAAVAGAHMQLLDIARGRFAHRPLAKHIRPGGEGTLTTASR